MFISDPHSATPTFTAPGANTLVFQLVVTDSLGLSSAPASVTVVVTGYRLLIPLARR